MSELKPPKIQTEDPGAHDISDNSDDHFSSASEGTPNSPIPITRVERVDDSAAHGEVPGTDAYNLRTQDAVPDEVEIVPEGGRSRSHSTQGRGRGMSQLAAPESRSETPGGSPIPKTVLEKVDDRPSHGEVDGTAAKDMRMADAAPDEVRKAPRKTTQSFEGRGQEVEQVQREAEDEEERQAWFRNMWEGTGDQSRTHIETGEDALEQEDKKRTENEEEENGDGFGDDFDDFAEGDGNGDDFGDFDEAEETNETDPPRLASDSGIPDLPPLSLLGLSNPSEIRAAIAPYIAAISPEPSKPTESPSYPPPEPSPFLSDRSYSLWQQLVSPPPMQPPNWTRSRIRRLFLVSLGVPVDLDEILPPSKQKRLVLPSLGLEDGENERADPAITRIRDQDANDSTTSLESKSKRRPRGPPPPPDFDLIAATRLCGTTVEALTGFSDERLRGHAAQLEDMRQRASVSLEFWLVRRDEGVKEKEALEGVVGNLVGFVKGRRGK